MLRGCHKCTQLYRLLTQYLLISISSMIINTDLAYISPKKGIAPIVPLLALDSSADLASR